MVPGEIVENWCMPVNVWGEHIPHLPARLFFKCRQLSHNFTKKTCIRDIPLPHSGLHDKYALYYNGLRRRPIHPGEGIPDL